MTGGLSSLLSTPDKPDQSNRTPRHFDQGKVGHSRFCEQQKREESNEGVADTHSDEGGAEQVLSSSISMTRQMIDE
jgi:hypothetical protein